MFRRFCLFVVQKACAQPVWIITFKIGEIKLIANDNTYKCVIIQNTSACLHAFKCSFGYNNRTLLSYSYSSSCLACNNWKIKRKDIIEAWDHGVPSERTRWAQGRAGAEPGTHREFHKPQRQELGCGSNQILKSPRHEQDLQGGKQPPTRTPHHLAFVRCVGGIWAGFHSVSGHFPVVKRPVAPI